MTKKKKPLGKLTDILSDLIKQMMKTRYGFIIIAIAISVLVFFAVDWRFGVGLLVVSLVIGFFWPKKM